MLVGTLQEPRPVLLLACFHLKVEVEKGSSIMLSTREFAIVRGGNLRMGTTRAHVKGRQGGLRCHVLLLNLRLFQPESHHYIVFRPIDDWEDFKPFLLLNFTIH